MEELEMIRLVVAAYLFIVALIWGVWMYRDGAPLPPPFRRKEDGGHK